MATDLDNNQLNGNLTPTDIKIGALNVNSIVAMHRRHCLQKFIDTHKMDILLISETKLKKIHKPEFQGYSFIRTDRPDKGGGGTAILVSDSIQFSVINRPNSLKNKILEYTVIKLFPSAKTPILLFSIYAPTRNTFIKELNKLYSDFQLMNDSYNYIIAGDFNARNLAWNDTSTNLRGAQLEKWEQDHGIIYRARLCSPITPTCPAANSYLDHCLLDVGISIIDLVNDKLQTIPHDSDHNAIKFTIKLKSKHQITPISSQQNHTYSYKKTNWKKFSKHLDGLHKQVTRPPDDRNLTIEEIDTSLL